jgi:cyclophilin family peptidyl-prolyl cis-trans isomerase
MTRVALRGGSRLAAVGTEKRERQKEGRQQRLAAEQAEARQNQRRRRLVAAVLVSVVVFGALVLISQTGGDDETDTAAEGTTTTAPPSSSSTTPAAPAAFEYGTGECPPPEKPAEPVRQFEAAPQRCIEDGVDYAAVLTTSEGQITVDLLEDEAPGTVNNFVVLARYGYYDNDDFHRIIPGFVVQGGDPVGEPPGTGGPGYMFPDEVPASVEDYVEGSVAMANSGPDTNGSQFFIYLGPNTLPGPQYSLFGQVTEGLEVAKAIEALGSDSGEPQQVVSIESVGIVEQ